MNHSWIIPIAVITVDAYLLEVNAVAINTTETRAFITLLSNVTDITIDLRAINCFGLTPATTFNLNLHQGKMTGLCYPKRIMYCS